MKLLDETTPAPIAAPSMLLHGLTGNGKSWWATTGGTPLALLFEAKAMSVLRQINPQAVGFVPESVADLDALLVVLGELHSPTGRPMLSALWSLFFPGQEATPERVAQVRALAERLSRVDRVVLDSYTELTGSLPRWLRESTGAAGTLIKLELQEYGHLRDYAMAIVRAVQLSGLPSVIIARSTSKRVGLSESIRPDGAGKSVEDLPGKLLPTAEMRFDPERGYVVDTTPAEHSQRCGLPWIPAVYSGTCLEYLRLIQGGPQAVPEVAVETPAALSAPSLVLEAPVTRQELSQAREVPGVKSNSSILSQNPGAQPPAPRRGRPPKIQEEASPAPLLGSDNPEWLDAMAKLGAATVGLPEAIRKVLVDSWLDSYTKNSTKALADLQGFLAASDLLETMKTAPDPEADPEGYRKAFAAVCITLQERRRTRESNISQEVHDFVDGLTPNAPAINPPAEVVAYQNALTELAQAAFKSGATEAERKAIQEKWSAKGPESLQDLRQVIADLTRLANAPKPTSNPDRDPGSQALPRATPEDVSSLLDLANQHNAPLDALWRYALVKGGAKTSPDGSPNWFSLSATFVDRISPQFTDPAKRTAFLAWLKANHSKEQ